MSWRHCLMWVWCGHFQICTFWLFFILTKFKLIDQVLISPQKLSSRMHRNCKTRRCCRWESSAVWREKAAGSWLSFPRRDGQSRGSGDPSSKRSGDAVPWRQAKHGSTPEEEYALAWSRGVRSKQSWLWIVAFCDDQGLRSYRVFGRTRPPTEFELVFDASPWGLGGILTTASSGEALQFFHEPLTAEDCQSRVGRRQGAAVLGSFIGAGRPQAVEPLGCQVAGGRQSQERFGNSFAMHCKVGKFLTASEWDWGGNRLGARAARRRRSRHTGCARQDQWRGGQTLQAGAARCVPAVAATVAGSQA